MPKIRYEFQDGTISEVEVSDKLFSIYAELEKTEKHNNKRETRRHISLDYLNVRGVDFEDSGDSPLTALISKEESDSLHKLLKHLSDKHRALLEKVFFDGMSLREIAKQTGLTHQALSQQMATALKKLKNLL